MRQIKTSLASLFLKRALKILQGGLISQFLKQDVHCHLIEIPIYSHRYGNGDTKSASAFLRWLSFGEWLILSKAQRQSIMSCQTLNLARVKIPKDILNV